MLTEAYAWLQHELTPLQMSRFGPARVPGSGLQGFKVQFVRDEYAYMYIGRTVIVVDDLS